jgi:hypothetical protein
MSDNSENKKPASGISYSQFLLILVLVNALLIIGLAIASQFLKATDSPPPLQFLITTILSVFVLSAVIFQAFVYWQQWSAMQAQLNETKRSLKLTEDVFYFGERAYLALKHMTVGGDTLAAGKAPELKIEVKNGGRTPAFDVKIAIKCGMVSLDNLERIITDKMVKAAIEKYFEDKKWIETVIGQCVLPGELARGGIGGGHPLDTIHFTNWQAAHACFYIVLKITYFDIKKTNERAIVYHAQFSKKKGLSLTECYVPEDNDITSKEKPN